MHKSRVIWITGLSGAGKTTLSKKLALKLRADGEQVILLDGDELREVFGAVLNSSKNFGRKGRLDLGMHYSHLCKLLAKQGVTVIIATIALFHEIHKWNRANIPRYFEVYLRVPLDELRRRDPKGIYKRFDNGELRNIAGLDLKVDEPVSPDLCIDFSDNLDSDQALSALLDSLKKKID